MVLAKSVAVDYRAYRIFCSNYIGRVLGDAKTLSGVGEIA